MPAVVLASANRHKYEEFTFFFETLEPFVTNGVKLLCRKDAALCIGEIEENGNCYEENALTKAQVWANATGLPALADDSGLEVEMLGWRPGIHSARVVEGSDADRVEWLLKQMAGAANRRACFVACLVLAFPGEMEKAGRNFFSVAGRCWGQIAKSPAGDRGFGYDPVFIPDGYDRSFAALGPDVKSLISHRAIAIHGVAEIISSVLKYASVFGRNS